MTAADIAQLRLYNQHLVGHRFTHAGDLLRHVGALQAQDFLAAKYSVAARLPGFTDDDVEQAIADKSIIRTWTQRGTLHFVAPENVRWMLDIVGPRLLSGLKGMHAKLKLTDNDFTESSKIINKTLKGGKHITRDGLKQLLISKGYGAGMLQYNQILLYAALTKQICLGPRVGKEHTFVLLDEWVPAVKPIKREEALGKYAQMYFQSHAPATIADFAWWAGITLADAKIGFEQIKDSLVSEVVNGETYYFSPSLIEEGAGLSRHLSSGGEASVFLLPSFDEFLIAYKERSISLNPKYNKVVMGIGNGLFAPIVVVNGIVQGTWKRTLKKDTVQVEILPFTKFNTDVKKAIKLQAEQYAGYLGMKLEMV